MNSLLKRAMAECIGTFVLVFAACGVAAITSGVTELVGTALAFGLVIVAMAYSVGRISGCHINPAVSIAMLATKKMNLKEFCAYVFAQFFGGFLGGVALFGIAKLAGYQLLGNACNYVINNNVYGLSAGTIFASLGLEVVLTFIFVYVILNVTDEKAKFGNLAGIVIGLTLTLVHLVGIRLTGTSVNPARSFATAINDLIFNGGSAEALKQYWIFLVAPLVGGLLAAVVFKKLHAEK